MADEAYIDPAALNRSLSVLAQTSSMTPFDALQEVLAATRQLFAASGAGFMMLDDNSMLCSVAATDEPGKVLEGQQEKTGHGPCVEAVTLDQITVTSDLATDDRWPELLPDVPEAGVRAVLGIPIRVSGLPVAALNVYRDRPHDWSDSEIAALSAYGGLIEGLLRSALQAREHEILAKQLQHALNHRIVIERAVGVIMGREGLDPVTAFNRLRDQARSSQQKVADVAASLLDEAIVGL